MSDEDRDTHERDRRREPPAQEPEAAESGGEGQAAETVNTQPQAAGTASAAGRPSKSWLAALSLGLLLAVAAAAAAGFSWWQQRQLTHAVQAADARTRDVSERQHQLENSLGELTDKLNGLRQQTRQNMQQSGQRIDALEQRLQPIPGRIAQLREQLDALQGGSADVRATWLRAAAGYYLRAANTQLQLAHDWQGAVEALKLADGQLRELGDPSLAPVRRLIAQEIDALQAVQLPDIDGLAARLDALASRAGKLALRAATPARFTVNAPPAQKTQPGWGRFWAAIKRALSGLVRVQRRAEPAQRALTDEQRALVRRQLAVELQLAEVAAVRRRPAAFRANIEAARQLLTENFDASDAGVAAAQQSLMQMSGIDIAPAPPDISQSLTRLQAAGGGI
jgi:uncharacterized protein HemX